MCYFIRHIRRKAFFVVFIAIFIFLPICANALQQKTVNILTWWGYLDHPEVIAAAEKSCGVSISHDVYYTNDEFLRRWRQDRQAYDVIIFSNTIYDVVKSGITPIPESKLSWLTHDYNPVIRRNYNLSHYPQNVVYFAHSLTGVLYNTTNISISKTDTLESLFKKAKLNTVIIIDDATEAHNLYQIYENSVGKYPSDTFNADGFKGMTKNSNVYIGNGFTQLYKKEDFAFSFTWSGEGIKRAKYLGKNFAFFVLPNISYISTDLLAQTANTKSAECVSMFLASKKTLSEIEKTQYYFSPYAGVEGMAKSSYPFDYDDFLNSLSRFHWIKPVKTNDFDQLNQSWNLIKLSYFNHG